MLTTLTRMPTLVVVTRARAKIGKTSTETATMLHKFAVMMLLAIMTLHTDTNCHTLTLHTTKPAPHKPAETKSRDGKAQSPPLVKPAIHNHQHRQHQLAMLMMMRLHN